MINYDIFIFMLIINNFVIINYKMKNIIVDVFDVFDELDKEFITLILGLYC